MVAVITRIGTKIEVFVASKSVLCTRPRLVIYPIGSVDLSLSQAEYLGPLLLTWFNVNPSMDE